MKTIGIVGSRRRDTDGDYFKVLRAFEDVYEDGDYICSGMCKKGADSFAIEFAEIYHIPEYKRIWFPPNFTKYGRGAYHARNTQIAENSDILIACVAEDRTGGTEDTIRKFTKLGKTELILV